MKSQGKWNTLIVNQVVMINFFFYFQLANKLEQVRQRNLKTLRVREPARSMKPKLPDN